MSDAGDLIRRYEERLAAFEARLARVEGERQPAPDLAPDPAPDLASDPAPDRPRGGLRLGVDVGGTFTDLLLLDPERGRTVTAKVPSTPDDSSRGVLAGIEKICRLARVEPSDIGEVMHGTTVATNAVLTGSGARVGLVTTHGYRDVLQVARSFVPGGLGGWVIWNKRPPLAPLELTIEAHERVAADGSVVEPLDEDRLGRDLQALMARGVEALTVALFNAHANDAHERRVAEIAARIAPGVPVSTSAAVSPEMFEYERTETTVVNSYVRPVVSRYVESLAAEIDGRMRGAGLQILRSDGGLSSSRAAMEAPVNLLMSGPAGGVSGALWIAGAGGFENLLTFDMGGTSTDVALIEGGRARTRRETRVGDVTVRAPSIDVRSVGAGGGSIAYVPELTRALRVGPQSAGAAPGPAAYGHGGEAPTVTDANVVLGYLPSDARLGGDMALDREAAARAVGTVAEALGTDLETAAEGIVRIVNENMTGALRLVSVEQGYDPRDFALIGFGGAGPLHVNALARLVGSWPAIVPPGPGVLCASGDATTRLRDESGRTFVSRVDETSDAEVTGMLEALRAEAARALASEGVAEADLEATYQIDVRYRGQGTSLPIDVSPEDLARDGLRGVASRFDAEHEQLFTFALEAPHEVVSLRAVVQGPDAARPSAAATAEPGAAPPGRPTRIYEGGAWHEARIHDRAGLSPGHRVEGPAIVAEMDSTTLILPGHEARVDGVGNLLIRPQGHDAR